jgi:hypothetical protein
VQAKAGVDFVGVGDFALYGPWPAYVCVCVCVSLCWNQRGRADEWTKALAG